MKKILLVLLILILTGCGKKDCKFTFDDNMTNDYSKDILNCKSATYTSANNNLEVITTPSKDGKKFTAMINYNNLELYNIFSKLEFVNVRIYKHKNNMFLELYNDNKVNNVSLIVFDIDGNVRRSKGSISKPILNDDSFVVVEELITIDDDSDLCKFYDKEVTVRREITYDLKEINKIKTTDIKVKDFCK